MPVPTRSSSSGSSNRLEVNIQSVTLSKAGNGKSVAAFVETFVNSPSRTNQGVENSTFKTHVVEGSNVLFFDQKVSEHCLLNVLKHYID
jgi:hypothetical protein